MPVPPAERVVYKHNPLEQVVCQLRFPPILKIESGLPSDFQEQLRIDYPEFDEIIEEQVPVPAAGQKISPEMLNLIAGFSSSRTKKYELTSDDGKWSVALTSGFLALTSTNYVDWTEFRERLEQAIAALLDSYTLTYYTRIGLRYVNLIKRSKLETELPWSELINPHIAGTLADPELDQNFITMTRSQTELELDEWKTQVRVAHGLVVAKENNEPSYFIDNDFFTREKTQTEEALERLKYFNELSGRFFKWSISDKLHDLLGVLEE